MDKMLLTVPDLAEALGISISSAYIMVREGRVPGVVHLGKSLRIHRETVREWLEAQVEREKNG